MPEKPRHAADYTSEQVELVRATCLYVATRLGDLMDDLVVVGGLVPSLRNIEPDFAAIIAPGLALAFEDRQRVTIDGRTLLGEKASRQLWICGAGAFVVLKALAFDSRGENKDAYDLYYVVRNFGAGIVDLAEKIRPLLRDAEAQRALAILRRDFLDPEGVGPRRVADFLVGGPDDDVQADVAGFVSLLLDRCS